MLRLFTALALALAAVTSASYAPPARADDLTSGITGRNLCATVYNNRLITSYCGKGDAQDWFTPRYGQQIYHGLCLDSEVSKDWRGQPLPNSAAGAQLVVTQCLNKPSQRWSLYSDGSMHNESGWRMDVNGGSVSEGTKIQIWNCNYQNHQKWTMGSLTTAKAVLPPLVVAKARDGDVYSPDGRLLGTALIPSDSASVIAAGGGNVIAAGGGNILVTNKVIAAGGGNVVGPGAGSLLSPNGGNLGAVIMHGGAAIVATSKSH